MMWGLGYEWKNHQRTVGFPVYPRTRPICFAKGPWHKMPKAATISIIIPPAVKVHTLRGFLYVIRKVTPGGLPGAASARWHRAGKRQALHSRPPLCRPPQKPLAGLHLIRRNPGPDPAQGGIELREHPAAFFKENGQGGIRADGGLVEGIVPRPGSPRPSPCPGPGPVV